MSVNIYTAMYIFCITGSISSYIDSRYMHLIFYVHRYVSLMYVGKSFIYLNEQVNIAG